MKELNFELLKELYCIHSKSMKEKKMRVFIKEWISGNVPDAIVKEDDTGNLYVTKGQAESYPCLCSHMDQVQELHPDDFMCYDAGGIIAGFSHEMRRQCGLGADDKNGIFISLSCLQKYEALKCAFFVGEEIGCVGSSSADMDFFSDCRFCVQIDRKGNEDMVIDISGAICSDEFVAATECEKWGYNISHGMMTDVHALVENGVGVSCINLSCGYYAPHTDCEFVSKKDIIKCYRFVCHLIEDCTDIYPYKRSDTAFSVFDKEDQFYEFCDKTIAQYPEVIFGDIYKVCKEYFPDLTKKTMRKIFTECKSYYNFGN